MNLREWQKRNRLSNSDILTPEYLERIKSEPELVWCACGCDQLRLRFDKNGIERQFIQHHQSRGRKLSAGTIKKMQETKRRNRELLIERVSERDRKIEEMIREGLFTVGEGITSCKGIFPRRMIWVKEEA